MLELLVVRERVRAFYGKYAAFVHAAVRFLVVLCAAHLITSNLDYMKALKGPVAVLFPALLSLVLPYGAAVWLLGIMVLLEIYSVSIEMTVVTGVFLLVVALLYYGFTPGDSVLLIVTPLLFVFRIPFVVPVIAGLTCSAAAVIPVSSGIVLYYILSYVKANAGALSGGTTVAITQRYTQMINAVISNREMLLLIVAFSVTLLTVRLIRALSIDYAWIIAVSAGIIMMLVILFLGDFVYDIQVLPGRAAWGVAVTALVSAVYLFMRYNVDYMRTEYTQFEDDEYFYYVKAVPKITVSAPETRIQKLTPKRSGRRSDPAGGVSND